MTDIEDLMDQGYTWEEAEDLLSRRAEHHADAARDAAAEASLYNQGESK